MPGRDGSGPDGKGPLTGRGMGYCNTNFSQIKPARRGLGRRRGRRFRGRF